MNKIQLPFLRHKALFVFFLFKLRILFINPLTHSASFQVSEYEDQRWVEHRNGSHRNGSRNRLRGRLGEATFRTRKTSRADHSRRREDL